MAESKIEKSVWSVIQHNTQGDAVGYYATRIYQASEMANVTQGTVQVINNNGTMCIKTANLVCTPDVPIIDLSAYVGSGTYAYDPDGGSKMFIDRGKLYCKESNMGHRILTFLS